MHFGLFQVFAIFESNLIFGNRRLLFRVLCYGKITDLVHFSPLMSYSITLWEFQTLYSIHENRRFSFRWPWKWQFFLYSSLKRYFCLSSRPKTDGFQCPDQMFPCCLYLHPNSITWINWILTSMSYLPSQEQSTAIDWVRNFEMVAKNDTKYSNYSLWD